MALLAPASSAGQDAGNNGTVKIHEGATETEPIVHNEPHVCTFHLHFFFADPFQAGSWEIQEWSPGDKGIVVLSGTYDTNDDGEDRQPEDGAYELPDGHYKLFWDGDTDKHDKMKVFWVDCEETTTTTTTDTTTTDTTTTDTTTTTTETTTTDTQTVGGTTTTTDTTTTDTTATDTTTTGTETTATTSTTTTFSQDVGAETDAPPGGGPTVTLPPTDQVAGARPADDSWRAMLIAMAALLAVVLVITPSPAASSISGRRR